MRNICPACTKETTASCRASLFTEAGTSVGISLCRNHDIELFRIGQHRFLLKHNLSLKSLNPVDGENGDFQDFADIA